MLIAAGLAAALQSSIIVAAQCDNLPAPASAQVKTNESRLINGLYLVVQSDEDKSKIAPLKGNERLLVNDYSFLDPDERGKTEYIVLNNESYVPFEFSSAPGKGTDDKGRPLLTLQLDEKQIKPLEEFTSKNLGARVAIVVDNKIVTVHKIRTVITGGRLQITRCSDHGCTALYSVLKVGK